MLFRRKYNRKDVLVVDDDPVLTRILSHQIEKAGFRFDTALNGQLALDLLKRNTYRTALVDFNMPGMNGFELCRKIRKTRKHRRMHIILMSAEMESPTPMPEEIDEFVGKPFGMNAIIEKLKGIISSERVNKK